MDATVSTKTKTVPVQNLFRYISLKKEAWKNTNCRLWWCEYGKVQFFQEDNKELMKSSKWFEFYMVNVKSTRRSYKNFVAFLKILNNLRNCFNPVRVLPSPFTFTVGPQCTSWKFLIQICRISKTLISQKLIFVLLDFDIKSSKQNGVKIK